MSGTSSAAQSPSRARARICRGSCPAEPYAALLQAGGRTEHISLGYVASKMTVIPNGVDATLFRPDPQAHGIVCDELGLPRSAVLIGLPAAFRPEKNHAGFAEAAARVAARRVDARFVLCGNDVSDSNHVLQAMLERQGLRGRYHLLGARKDMPRLMAAFRVVVSSSHSEGFPNILAEAMACGTVCVAADVGDSAQIIGATGVVVPPDDPSALANAILDRKSTRLN